MKEQHKVVIQPQHYSQYIIEGGEIFALEGIALGIAGGWWLCQQTGWHWLVGVVVGLAILTGFMWLLTIRLTRWLVVAFNALGGALLSYLVSTALFGASDLTGGFIGVLTGVGIAALLTRRFVVFSHDLNAYRKLKKEQTNRGEQHQ